MVIPGHNLGSSQVSVNMTIGPTLVYSTDDPGLTLIYFTARSNFGVFNHSQVSIVALWATC